MAGLWAFAALVGRQDSAAADQILADVAEVLPEPDHRQHLALTRAALRIWHGQLQEGHDLAAAVHDAPATPALREQALYVRSSAFVAAGRLDRARTEARQAIETWSPGPERIPTVLMFLHHTVAESLALLGDLDAYDAAVESFVPRFPPGEPSLARAHVSVATAVGLRLRGQLTDATEVLIDAADDELPPPPFGPLAHAELAMTAAMTWQAELAQRALKQANRRRVPYLAAATWAAELARPWVLAAARQRTRSVQAAIAIARRLRNTQLRTVELQAWHGALPLGAAGAVAADRLTELAACIDGEYAQRCAEQAVAVAQRDGVELTRIALAYQDRGLLPYAAEAAAQAVAAYHATGRRPSAAAAQLHAWSLVRRCPGLSSPLIDALQTPGADGPGDGGGVAGRVGAAQQADRRPAGGVPADRRQPPPGRLRQTVDQEPGRAVAALPGRPAIAGFAQGQGHRRAAASGVPPMGCRGVACAAAFRAGDDPAARTRTAASVASLTAGTRPPRPARRSRRSTMRRRGRAEPGSLAQAAAQLGERSAGPAAPAPRALPVTSTAVTVRAGRRRPDRLLHRREPVQPQHRHHAVAARSRRARPRTSVHRAPAATTARRRAGAAGRTAGAAARQASPRSRPAELLAGGRRRRTARRSPARRRPAGSRRAAVVSAASATRTRRGRSPGRQSVPGPARAGSRPASCSWANGRPDPLVGEHLGHQVGAEPRWPGSRVASGQPGHATRGRTRRAPPRPSAPARAARRGGALGVLGQHREVEGPLAGEVGVDRAPGQPGPLGDAVDLGVAVAAAANSSRAAASTLARLRSCVSALVSRPIVPAPVSRPVMQDSVADSDVVTIMVGTI